MISPGTLSSEVCFTRTGAATTAAGRSKARTGSTSRIRRRDRSTESGIEHDLAGSSFRHGRKAFLELLERKFVGDDSGEIEAALGDQGGALVPRFIHPPAYHAVNRDPLEDDVTGHVHFVRLLRQPEETDPAAALQEP